MSDSPEEVTSKKLQAKRARREADERKAAEQKRAQRRRTLITTGLALGVGALVVALIVSQNKSTGPTDDIGGPTSASEAGCSEDQEHELEGATHVDEGTLVEYETDPPTSGNHWPPGSQAGPGFYETAVESERLVHNLEHGQIVIWYKPDAPEDVKDKIQQVTEQDEFALIAVPYDFDGAGEYALTAWGWSQTCETPSQTVVEDFRKAHQGKGPEAVTPPYSG